MEGKIATIIVGIILILFLGGCQDDDISLEGKWERFDAAGAGAILKVNRVGETYRGTLVHVGPRLQGGFESGDVKWREIVSKTENYYEGNDLIKFIDSTGRVERYEYEEVYFELVSFDILKVRSFAESKYTGSIQKWKRIQ